MPISTYRMGKPNNSYDRLLKVVFPSSFFANLTLRRAPRLRNFPFKSGVFIRPSLSKEERDRLRARRDERLKVRQSNGVNANAASSVNRSSEMTVAEIDNRIVSAHDAQDSNTSMHTAIPSKM